ncbi:hypothetical protein ADUPG1_007874 [Aduncisulcus paluster]|uniref:Rab-GAP TBC domain-containing protein n=1 Tax=Aduncisulcus paluster TaxID=2918883 RepID=A0ABQ5KPW2_9EUKA|nr:hypothetical protein ADUPG1_007874 [Aduncisulcus paluster]
MSKPVVKPESKPGYYGYDLEHCLEYVEIETPTSKEISDEFKSDYGSRYSIKELTELEVASIQAKRASIQADPIPFRADIFADQSGPLDVIACSECGDFEEEELPAFQFSAISRKKKPIIPYMKKINQLVDHVTEIEQKTAVIRSTYLRKRWIWRYDILPLFENSDSRMAYEQAAIVEYGLGVDEYGLPGFLYSCHNAKSPDCEISSMCTCKEAEKVETYPIYSTEFSPCSSSHCPFCLTQTARTILSEIASDLEDSSSGSVSKQLTSAIDFSEAPFEPASCLPPSSVLFPPTIPSSTLDALLPLLSRLSVALLALSHYCDETMDHVNSVSLGHVHVHIHGFTEGADMLYKAQRMKGRNVKVSVPTMCPAVSKSVSGLSSPPILTPTISPSPSFRRHSHACASPSQSTSSSLSVGYDAADIRRNSDSLCSGSEAKEGYSSSEDEKEGDESIERRSPHQKIPVGRSSTRVTRSLTLSEASPSKSAHTKAALEYVCSSSSSLLKKLKEAYRKGVPKDMRRRVWPLAVGNRLHITSDLYEIHKKRATEACKLFDAWEKGVDGTSSSSSSSSSASKLSSASTFFGRESTVQLIAADVARTFPRLSVFRKGGSLHLQLIELLSTYCIYRPDIGYLQGMSFIAAMLLLFLDQANAFFVFCNLINLRLVFSFCRLDEHRMNTYIALFKKYFKITLPELYNHLIVKLDIDCRMFLTDWILSLFVHALPLSICTRLWDCLVFEGELFILRACLGILKVLESKLMNLDFDDVTRLLNKLPRDESKLGFTADELSFCIYSLPKFHKSIKRQLERDLTKVD